MFVRRSSHKRKYYWKLQTRKCACSFNSMKERVVHKPSICKPKHAFQQVEKVTLVNKYTICTISVMHERTLKLFTSNLEINQIPVYNHYFPAFDSLFRVATKWKKQFTLLSLTVKQYSMTTAINQPNKDALKVIF